MFNQWYLENMELDTHHSMLYLVNSSQDYKQSTKNLEIHYKLCNQHHMDNKSLQMMHIATIRMNLDIFCLSKSYQAYIKCNLVHYQYKLHIMNHTSRMLLWLN